MDPFVELLKEINIAQIFIMFAGGWVFYTRLDKKITDVKVDLKNELSKVESGLKSEISKVESGLNSKIDKVESGLNSKIDKVESGLNSKIDKLESGLNKRIDKLSEKVEDIDRRLCRIEGGIGFAHFAYQQARTQKVNSQPEEPTHPQEGAAEQ